MDFLLSDELLEFSHVLRDFLRQSDTRTPRRVCIEQDTKKRLPEKEARSPLWKQIAELGLLSASLPEDCDGLALGSLGYSIAAEASGEFLLSDPLFETVALGAIPLVTLGDRELTRDTLSAIGGGATAVTGGYEELLRDRRQLGRASEGSQDSFTLTGTWSNVPAVCRSDSVILPALLSDNQSLELFAVSIPENEQRISREYSLDLVRQFYTLRLEGVSGVRLTSGPLAEPLISAFRDLLYASIAAELVGVGRQAIAMTVEYVKQREQYGRPVGSFQAVQHQLVDALLAVEQSHALERFAFWCCDHDINQRSIACKAAKAFAGERMVRVVETALQLHGGIGFTFEYDLHLYLRRAQSLAHWFAAPGEDFEEISRMYLTQLDPPVAVTSP